MMLIQTLLACHRPATAPPTDDTGSETCPVPAESTSCGVPAFPIIEGRVELRQVLPGFTRPICVADASTQEACQWLLGTACPDTADALLTWVEEQGPLGSGCREERSYIVRDPRLRRIHCAVPAEIDYPTDQLHSLDFYYDGSRLVAVYDYRTAVVSNDVEDYCCSEGGRVEQILWSDELFFECGEAE